MKRTHLMTAALTLMVAASCPADEKGWLGSSGKEPSSVPATPPPGPLAGTYGATAGLDLFAGIPLEPDPATARRFFEDGRQQSRMGQHRLAVNRFRSAYKRGYDRLDLDYYLAPVLLEMGKPRRGLFHVDTAMALGGADTYLTTLAGRGYLALGDARRAIESLERAIQLDPASGEAHFRLALAYDQIDNSPKVLEHAQKAIRIDPSYKAKLKPIIKDSSVSRNINRIVGEVLKDSKYERLSEEKIEAYAGEIENILGDERSATEPGPAP